MEMACTPMASVLAWRVSIMLAPTFCLEPEEQALARSRLPAFSARVNPALLAAVAFRRRRS
jgi:hypothetical protein